MRIRVFPFALFLALVFWAFAQGQGWAQTANDPQNVKITHGPVVERSDSNTAVIAWSTNVNANTVVRYGTDRNNLDRTAQAPWGGLTHRTTLHNLEPNTTYYFRVESGQAQGTGTQALSDISQFQTTGGHAASAGSSPSPVAKIIAGPIPEQLTDKAAVIFWQTNAPSASTVKYGTDAAKLNQTATAPDTSENHKVKLDNLQPSTKYYFAPVRPDGLPHKTGEFMTKAPNFTQTEKVRITDGPVFEYLADNQAVIAWTTNLPASTQVRYGITPDMSQVKDGPWGTTHRVTLTGLKPDQGYYFLAESATGPGTGNMAQAQQAVFATIPSGQQALKLSKP